MERRKIITVEVCKGHVHMLIEIPPKMSVSGFMGFLKGKSSRIIYQKWGNMKYKYRNRSFWCRGYYVDTAGKNDGVIRKYIDRRYFGLYIDIVIYKIKYRSSTHEHE